MGASGFIAKDPYKLELQREAAMDIAEMIKA